MSALQKSVTAFVPAYDPRPSPALRVKKFSRTDNLALWHNVTLQTVQQNGPDLTTRQLALLMSVYLDSGPHTVRSLAAQLGVTKAVISRAVDRLCKYGFIQRAPDPNDGRSVLLKRTSTGIHYLQGFADIIHGQMPDGARLLGQARFTLPPHVSVPDYTSQIIKPYTALRRHPAPRAPLDTELLFGQGVDVYEIDKGLALVKVRPLIGSSERPLYIGYVKASAIAAQLKLSDTGQGNKSYVTALAAPVFLKADIKSHIIMALPMNSIIRGYGEDEKFIQMAKGYIHKKHVSPTPIFDDFVVAAAQFMGRPYIWGGTGGLGVDCSGLVQMALCASGIDAPRDADQQEMYLGDDITGDPYQRGDLIFWTGHVGIMQNSAELLHANAFHMKTASEPLAVATKRIGPPRRAKRLVRDVD